jgi:hypothetical protein
MNASLVKEVHTELKRILIAGCEYSRGDEALKRLENKLRAGGNHAAVYTKLAGLLMKCHSPPNGTDCAPYLTEAFSLTNATAVSLSSFKANGPVLPVTGPAPHIGTPMLHSELYPLIEALTVSSKGRIEAVARGLKNGVNDLRLLPVLNTALDDRCAGISKLAAQALLNAGTVCVALLESSFDLKRGSRGNVRRFTVLALLKDDADFIQNVLANGVKELRAQAAALLRDMERFYNKEGSP